MWWSNKKIQMNKTHLINFDINAKTKNINPTKNDWNNEFWK
jgi:hypothetical protein